MTMSSFVAELVGSFSTGAADNPTVAMMDAAFDHHGLNWRYVNCEVPSPDLRGAVDGARAMGWRGFNCSIPHKQAVIALLDDLGTSAALCQAVNCVAREDPDDGSSPRWVGHNTDGVGFLRSLRDVTDPSGLNVFVIGSGGAAHAIAVELALAGAAGITVASRNPDTAGSLVALINSAAAGVGAVGDWIDDGPVSVVVSPETDVVVQATPVGMVPEDDREVVVDWSTASAGVIAADVVINPPKTRFLTRAEAEGAVVLDGTGMLVNQAVENMRLWTGVEADASVMRRALEATF